MGEGGSCSSSRSVYMLLVLFLDSSEQVLFLSFTSTFSLAFQSWTFLSLLRWWCLCHYLAKTYANVALSIPIAGQKFFLI